MSVSMIVRPSIEQCRLPVFMYQSFSFVNSFRVFMCSMIMVLLYIERRFFSDFCLVFARSIINYQLL